jgi:hypothetical protein
MADDWMFHNSPKPPPRLPRPDEEVWRQLLILPPP